MTDKNNIANKVRVRLEIVVYILWNSIASLGVGIVKVFLPAVDRRVGGRFSFVLRSIFSVITLEGPRLILLSRYRAAIMKRGTKVGISAISATAVAAIVVATVLISSQLFAVTVDGHIIGYVENEEQYASLLQKAKDKLSKQAGTDNSEILIQYETVTLDPVLAPQQQAMTPAGDLPPVAPVEEEDTVAMDAGAGAAALAATAANIGVGSAAYAADAVPDETIPEAVPDPGDTVDTVAADDSAIEAEPEPPAEQPAKPKTIIDAGKDILGALGVNTGEPVDPALEEEALVDSLIDSLIEGEMVKTTLYAININDVDVAILGTMVEARDVLNKIREIYLPTEGEYTGKFTDNIAINNVTANLGEITPQTLDEVVDFLLDGGVEERAYTTIEEDSIENISRTLGITEYQLREAYPEYDFSKIDAGYEFRTSVTVPYVHFQAEGNEFTIEDVPFATIEEKTNDLYLGQREVKTEGVLGERKVTRAVTRVNNVVVSEEELGSELVKESEPEIISVGTRVVESGEDAYVGPSEGTGGGGTGPLGRPLNSWYLSRSVGGGHMGADMCAPRGTPIFSAAYGRVSFTGVFGGYGNLVIIDHGNGLQTYYAHCDTINTTVGAIVQRGQQIATVGTTGRSTAYHLHFEVRYNGSVLEPLDWI